MHPDDIVPFGLAHIDQHTVAEYSCIVDQDVKRPKGPDGRLDETLCALPTRDIVSIGDRLSACPFDLLDDFVCWILVGPAAIRLDAEIVDYDLCAMGSEQQRIFSPHASTRTGHNGYASLTKFHNCPN